MSQNEKVYFGTASIGPLDGLSDASCVVNMLSAFIALSDDLQMFQRCPSNRAMDGLHIVLEGVQNAIETAASELGKVDAPPGAENREPATATYPKLPDLSAREAAIAGTYLDGYPPEEIARAVNLKQATVKRIIGQLKDSGSIPSEPDNLARAANT